MLSKLAPRETVVDVCARALRDAILIGDFSIGSRLPPERTLAEMFGVNRVSVRSALGALARDGLLQVRQGSGYQVRDYRLHAGPEFLPRFAEWAKGQGALPDLVADLLLVRRHLARAVFERLADRKDIDVEGIEAAIDRFAAEVDRGASTDAIAEADMEVLAAILAATGSAVLQLYYNPVRSVVTSLSELREALYAEPKSNVSAYRTLLTWLEHRGPEGVELIFSVLQEHDQKTLGRISRDR